MILSVLSISLFSEYALLFMSVLVFVALLMTKVGYRFGIPSLLLFLVLGIIAGNDVIGVNFDNYTHAQVIGEMAMSVILISSGLETDLKLVRPVMKQGLLLSTVGVLLTVAFTATFIFFLLGKGTSMPVPMTVAVSILLASVMSSTDSASVFSLLRNSRLRLKENIGSVLEVESGSNDPLAHIMTILMVGVVTTLQAGYDAGTGVSGGNLALTYGLKLLREVALGAIVGYVIGKATLFLFRSLTLNGGALWSIMILTIGFFSYGSASAIGGSGLLAIYTACIIMGNDSKMPYKKDVLKFMDGITWLVELLMFLMLGLLANPGRFPVVFLPAAAVALFMMLVARPLSVFVTLAPFKGLSFRGKLFISWVGLKGAGPILFAVAPVVAGIPWADRIFDLVFVVTLLSLIIQGMTLTPASKLLKVSIDEAPAVDTLGMEIPEELGDITNYTIKEKDLEKGNTLRDLHLPHGIRVIMVKRGDYYIAPHGSLVLKPDDMMVILISDHTEENIPEELQ